jgi:heme exporter protein D
MVEVFGVVVVTLMVGLVVWLMRFLESVVRKDARHARFDEANSEQERT